MPWDPGLREGSGKHQLPVAMNLAYEKTPGYRFGGETHRNGTLSVLQIAFVGERQLGPPAIWAEPAIRLGAGEVKQAGNR
jgi:hypothetical protein